MALLLPACPSNGYFSFVKSDFSKAYVQLGEWKSMGNLFRPNCLRIVQEEWSLVALFGFFYLIFQYWNFETFSYNVGMTYNETFEKKKLLAPLKKSNRWD